MNVLNKDREEAITFSSGVDCVPSKIPKLKL